jgi:hypothetical protein
MKGPQAEENHPSRAALTPKKIQLKEGKNEMARVFKGDDGQSFGVLDDDAALLYDADMKMEEARRIVQILNSADHEMTFSDIFPILEAEGFYL